MDSLLNPGVPDLQASLVYGSQFDPLKRARAHRVAKAAGTSPEVVADNPDAFAKEFLARNENYARIADETPTTARMLADPRNAELLHMELPSMTALERKHQETESSFGKSALGSWIKSSVSIGKGLLTDLPRSQAALMQPIVEQLSSIFPAYGEAMAKSDRTRNTVLDAVDQTLFAPGEQMAAQMIRDDDWRYKTLNAIAGSAPQIALAVLTRGKSAAPQASGVATGILSRLGAWALRRSPELLKQSAVMMPSVLNSEIDEFMQNNPGVDRQTAAGLSLVSAAAQSLIEGLVNVPVVDRLQAAKNVKQRLVGLLMSSGMEGAEEVAQRMTSQALLPDPSGKRTLSLQELWENFYGGAAAGVFFGGASALHGPKISASEKFIKALHDTKEQSKLLKQFPEALSQYVQELTKDGPVKEVMIPAEQWVTYWQQQNQDPAEKAVELGVDLADFETAVSGKSDIVISTADFYEKIAATEDFQPLFPHLRPVIGGPTFAESAQIRVDAAEAAADAKAVREEPQSPERAALKQQILADLTLAQARFTGKQLEDVADGYARVLMVLSRKSNMTPAEVLKRNRLSITRGFRDNITQLGADPDERTDEATAAGPDGNVADPAVQGAEAGREPGRVVGGAEPVRQRLPGQGASTPLVGWHGTEADPNEVVALKAEGLSRNQEGGMGPGLHISAGPQVASGYAKGNQQGLWKAAIQNLIPFDAAQDTTHSVETLKALGFTGELHEMTGAEAWDRLVHELGEDGAVAHLRSKGFNGLYYNHGGEDAWAVWDNASIRGSALTTEAQAAVEYERQGSWRDPVTGFLKTVAQQLNQGGVTLESAPGKDTLVGFDKLTEEQRAAYHVEKMKIAEKALTEAGIQVRTTTEGNGYWEGVSNYVTRFVVQPDQVQLAAQILADVVGDQDLVGWNKPVRGTKETNNALIWTFDRALTREEVLAIGSALDGQPVFVDNSTPTILRVGNYDDSLAGKMEQIAETVEGKLPSTAVVKSRGQGTIKSSVEVRSDGNEEERARRLQAAPAGRPRAGRAVSDGHAAVQELNAKYGLRPGGAEPEVGDITTVFQALASRVPTAVGVNADPTNVILSGLAAMLEHPASFAKNVALVQTYPGVKVDPGVSPEEAARQFIAHVEGNLLFLYNLMPEHLRKRAQQWYDGANKLAQEWAEKHDKTLAQVAGIMAALSPKADWFTNVAMAERVLTIMKYQQDTVWSKEMTAKLKTIPALAKMKELAASVKGKKLGELETTEQKAFWLRVYDETHNSKDYQNIAPEGHFVGPIKTTKGANAKMGWSFQRSIENAIDAFENASPLDISRALGNAHKVRNFYNNIFDPNSPDFTTIDTHAMNAALLLPMGAVHPIVGQGFGGTGSAKRAETGALGTYGLYQEGYAQAAAKVGVLPRQMQSITWEAIRSLFTDTFKTEENYNKIVSIWNRYTSGEITVESAREEIAALAGGIKGFPWDTQTVFQGGPAAGVITGVHYSPVAGLSELDPTKYGTGSPGAEQRRLRNAEPGLRARTFFYEVKDGVIPPKEAVVRGSNQYTATLTGIYDLDTDVLGLRQEYSDLNAMEQGLLDRGYRGYVATAPGMPARGIVVLGTEKVPVQPVPSPDNVTVMFQNGPAQFKPVDTSSPEFKAWFGEGSTFVNPDGSPKVAYHGTARAFTEFKSSQTGAMGAGIYFGLVPEAAVGYAGDGSGSRMIPVFLRGKYLDNYQWTDYTRKYGWKGAKDAAVKDGFSGVVDSKFEDAVVVWNPIDIKSAISNTGDFDPNNPNIMFQPAFHGSPYRFDKFTTDHIGTGEGAQAYGWGLYFAGNREVAEFYREKLGGNVFLYNGRELDGAAANAAELLWNWQGDVAAALDDLRFMGALGTATVNEMRRLIPQLDYAKIKRGGQTYKVEIPDTGYLLWDKPLSEQPQEVQDALQPFIAAWVAGEKDPNPVYRTLPDFARRLHDGSMLGSSIYKAIEGAKSAKDASLALRDAGLNGIKYLDGTSRSKGEGNYNFVIFDDAAVQVLETYYQPAEDNSPRGALQWTGPNGNREFNLALLKNENKSTVFHELGHFYLEVMGDLASMPSATQEIRDDYARILKWLGVNDRSEIKTEHHEKFADAHLAYLLEGKAPVAEMIPAFKRFSNWLAKLGNKLLGVQVQMSDEVRAIFDRLYATDEELAAAQNEMPDLFATAQEMGISQAEFNVLARKKKEAIEQAHEKLLGKLMREIAQDDRDERRAAKKRIREEVTAEIDAQPEYQALAALAGGEIGKLNRGLILDMHGQATLDGLDKRILRNDGELDPDAAAALTGFESGDALIEALTRLPARASAIAAETNSRFRAEYPTALEDGSVREKAIQALNGDARGDVLAAELKILSRNAEKVLALGREAAARSNARHLDTVASIRARAKAFIASKPLHKVNPFQFFQAQQKASREAYTAALKKDYATAKAAQERALLNHHLFREATKAKEAEEDFRDWVKRNDSARVRANLALAGDEYLAQFDALRDRFQIERESNKAIERKQTLVQFAESMKSQNKDAVIDPELLDETRTKNYREFTLAEMEGFWNALKNIKHLAYQETHAIVEGERIRRADMLQQIVDGGYASTDKLKDLMLGSDPRRKKAGFRLKNGIKLIDASLTKMELIAHWLDKGDVNGPFHRFIWNRIADAQTAEYDLHKQFTVKMADLLESLPKEYRHSLDGDNIDVPGMRRKWSRGQVLTMLLYSGQGVRRDKLVAGYAKDGMTHEGLDAAFAKLTAEDVKLANQVWAIFEELKPMEQALEKRLSGVAPEWDPARSFDIPAGHLTGGYFPLVADTKAPGELGKKQQGGPVGELFGNGYVRARTSQSHVQEITGAVYPLMLDYRFVMTAALANQIKDLTHREAVLDIKRIFESRSFQTMAQGVLGEQYEQQFSEWLAYVVNERNAGYAAAVSGWSNFLATARANATVAMLGLKATTVFMQILDPMRVTKPGPGMVKGRFMTQGLFKFLAHPVQSYKEAQEKSGEMRHLIENWDRDMRFQMQKAHGDLSLLSRWNIQAFKGLSGMAAMSATIAWHGSYLQAKAEGADEKTAVLRANETIRLKLQVGNPKDLPAALRKGETMKLLTMFMGDATANYTMLRGLGKYGLEKLPQLAYAGLAMIGAQMLAELIRGAGPDDDEDALEWALRKAMIAPTTMVPIVRDLGNAVDGVLEGNPLKAEYRFTPVLTVMDKGLKGLDSTTKLVKGEEEVEDWMIKMGGFLGFAFGVGGTSQAEASAKYLRRVQTGEENPDNVAELAFNAARGKKREK